MNDQDEIDFKMFQSVFEVMTKFKTSWQDNANIVVYNDRLSFIIRILTLDSAIKLKKPKGITVIKNAFRKTLESDVFNIKQALYLYYKKNSLLVDAALFDYNITKLIRMTDDAFYLEAIKVFERANVLAVSLLPYGITADQISKLGLDIIEFHNLRDSLSYALENDVLNNTQITEKINEGKKLFNEDMDVAVGILKGSAPEFVNSYFLARKRLKKPGNRKKYKVEIGGTVIDAITRLALMGVLVVAGLKNITTTTAKDGKYKVSVFKKDADFINFSLPEKYIQIKLPISKKYKKSKLVINAELLENIIEN